MSAESDSDDDTEKIRTNQNRRGYRNRGRTRRSRREGAQGESDGSDNSDNDLEAGRTNRGSKEEGCEYEYGEGVL